MPSRKGAHINTQILLNSDSDSSESWELSQEPSPVYPHGFGDYSLGTAYCHRFCFQNLVVLQLIHKENKNCHMHIWSSSHEERCDYNSRWDFRTWGVLTFEKHGEKHCVLLLLWTLRCLGPVLPTGELRRHPGVKGQLLVTAQQRQRAGSCFLQTWVLRWSSISYIDTKSRAKQPLSSVKLQCTVTAAAAF